MNKRKYLKKEKGITLISLIITIVIMLILAAVALRLVIGDNGLFKKATSAAKVSEIAGIKEQIQTELASEQLNENAQITDNQIKDVLQKHGTINYEENGTTVKGVTTSKGYVINLSDVWSGATNSGNPLINGSWSEEKGVSTPKLENTGLVPVYWNGSSWVKLTNESSEDAWNNWYDYSNQKWANAQSKDGSMWVWIPRYEYKIDQTNKTIDVKFTKIGEHVQDGYIMHPVFTSNVDNGGWDKELPGFWIAKYAAGYQNATVGETKNEVKYSNLTYTDVGSYSANYISSSLRIGETKISYPVFKANTYVYNIITAGDAFSLSRDIQNATDMYGLSNIDSHLVKNSEWGAVAYLTHSRYGLNGGEVSMNTKSLYNNIHTNENSSLPYASIYAITSYGSSGSANDINASTTKNMTGVFDMSGCVWERVAGFFKGAQSEHENFYSSIANVSTDRSTKYVTLYTADNKKGDAVNETKNWNGDYYYFMNSTYGLLCRGDNYSDTPTSNGGVFALGASGGDAHDSQGFRASLAY